jgi:peroxin-5
MGYTPAFSPPLEMGGMGMTTQQQQQDEFHFDESAFEVAFASAEREISDFFAEPAPEMVEEKGKQKEQLQKENDDLARTAGQLLDSVQENTSTKFQNSTFLALMRKIRDHEVVVEDNDMVEARPYCVG